MKIRKPGLWILSAVVLLSACDFSYNYPSEHYEPLEEIAEEPFGFQIPAEGHSLLKLSGVSSVVNITGVRAADSVKIQGKKEVRSRIALEAHRHLSDIRVEALSSPDGIFFNNVQPSSTYELAYTVYSDITLPDNFAVEIDTKEHSNITVGSVNNGVSIKMPRGDVELNNVHGNILVAINGSSSFKGNAVLLQDGIIDIRIGAEHTRGDITLTIPKETSAELILESSSGIVVSNLAVKDQVRQPSSYRGKLGDGRGKIILKSVNGRIRLQGNE